MTGLLDRSKYLHHRKQHRVRDSHLHPPDVVKQLSSPEVLTRPSCCSLVRTKRKEKIKSETDDQRRSQTVGPKKLLLSGLLSWVKDARTASRAKPVLVSNVERLLRSTMTRPNACTVVRVLLVHGFNARSARTGRMMTVQELRQLSAILSVKFAVTVTKSSIRTVSMFCTI